MTESAQPFPPLYEGAPYDYSAVAAPGSLLFTAGACPLDGQGQLVGTGDHVLQARAVMGNLQAVLALHGADVTDLVKTTIYVVGTRSDLVAVWDVVAEELAPSRPPSTLLGVAVLGYDGQLVEVEAIAVVPATR